MPRTKAFQIFGNGQSWGFHCRVVAIVVSVAVAVASIARYYCNDRSSTDDAEALLAGWHRQTPGVLLANPVRDRDEI